jgi:hypothetical protein
MRLELPWLKYGNEAFGERWLALKFSTLGLVETRQVDKCTTGERLSVTTFFPVWSNERPISGNIN